MKVLLVNGPNLNTLGTREPSLYGTTSLRDVVESLRARADARGVSLRDRQSNHEGTLIDFLQEHADADGAILNPGGLAHTSVVLRDAVKACVFPVVEVHITDITAREEFRRHSFLTGVVAHTVVGKGVAGYTEALDWLLDRIMARRI